MGVRRITDHVSGVTVLYDSVTEFAFGPVIRNAWTYPGQEENDTTADDLAEGFLDWLPDDARRFTEEELERQFYLYLEMLRTGRTMGEDYRKNIERKHGS